MPTSNICTEGLKYFDWIFLLKRFYLLEWNTTKPMIVMQFGRHLHFGKFKNKKYVFNKFEISRNMNMSNSNCWQKITKLLRIFRWHSHFLVKQLDLFEFKIVFSSSFKIRFIDLVSIHFFFLASTFILNNNI